MSAMTVHYQDELWSVLAETTQFGIKTYTLAGLPRRAYTDGEIRSSAPLVQHFVDIDAATALPTLGEAVKAKLASGDSWLSASRKTQHALQAWFLLTEDRQRRLVVREVSPLMHQLSLVEHILTEGHLVRVLIGDEVGLGKTVEAGLIAQRLLAAQPDLRVLYLSPARLVRNVALEFRRLGIEARTWIAGNEGDARIESDRIVIASVQKSVREANQRKLVECGPWDLLIVDECHHLSDWEPGGGSPNAGYRLVRELIEGQRPGRGRLLLLSGTPHQGHQARFENILELLRENGEKFEDIGGRVIYRTKESVRDWYGRPLFPRRDVRTARIAPLGDSWMQWYTDVGDLYDGRSSSGASGSRARAGGWAKGQALQWVASSVEAGLGFLVRLAIRRLNWNASNPQLATALVSIRPYRGGARDEPIDQLYSRILKQIDVIESQEDAEELDESESAWRPDEVSLANLLRRGTELRERGADAEKWRVMADVLREAGDEKVVLFCQPVETVGVVARQIESQFGVRPSIIMGGQDEMEREREIERFRDRAGAQFLVSSKAGGEGLNLQVSRRLLHLDIPWNPMDLEQRVGRVHRFGSRQPIIVETIVVPGTREADAYRIARDKLHLIAGQLDPERFELLFSRVMNLVPPEELASVFGTDSPWSPNGETEQRIATIVRSGYEKLSQFTERYSEGAEGLRSLDAGTADWSDLRDFVRRACGGEDGPAASIPVFSLHDEQIISNEAAVETLEAFGERFVCDESDGLPCHDNDGQPLHRLGMGHTGLLTKLREKLVDVFDNRLASVKLKKDALGIAQGKEAVVFVFATQRLTFSGGAAEEREVRLRVFVAADDAPPHEVEGSEVGNVVREIVSAERQAIPSSSALTHRISQIEALLIDQIQHLSNKTGGSPTAIWPVASVIAALS